MFTIPALIKRTDSKVIEVIKICFEIPEVSTVYFNLLLSSSSAAIASSVLNNLKIRKALKTRRTRKKLILTPRALPKSSAYTGIIVR